MSTLWTALVVPTKSVRIGTLCAFTIVTTTAVGGGLARASGARCCAHPANNEIVTNGISMHVTEQGYWHILPIVDAEASMKAHFLTDTCPAGAKHIK